MAELVVVVPTRGRPERAAELLETCRRTCTADTSIMLAVDDNDPTLEDRYRVLVAPGVSLLHVTEPAGHVRAINAGAEAAVVDGAWAVAKLDDDHRPRTRGWDSMMLAALRELGSGIVYANDLFQGAALATAAAMSSDIITALGFMAPPTLQHLYCDDFWRDLGRAADCLRYLPGVIVEHLHPLAGKAAMDEGYVRVNDPERYRADNTAYVAYQADRFERDVETVRRLREVTACP